MTPQPYRPVSYLEWNAARRGSSAAIWEGGAEISFEQLLAHVRRLQKLLAARGVRAGDVVGVRLPNVWQYVALELAIPEMGALIVPLPLALGEHEMGWVLGKTQPRLVVTSAELEALSGPAGGLPTPPIAAPDPARIVEIALSSGTTGMPKLASLSARLKQVTFESFTSRLDITADDRVLPMTPLTQGIGGMCLYCLRLGAALIMLREPHWSAEHCLETAAAARATVMVGVPTNVIRMLSQSVSLPTVRAVAVAGAPMPPEIAERWELTTRTPVSSFYGSMDAGQLAVASPSDPQAARWTTVGRPHDRAEWTIVDDEICMRGDLVQDRYWGEDSGPYSEDGWAHMGDLGFVDESGFLHVVGRVKDIIIRGGTNINPYEVESILRTHPGIADACVVARSSSYFGFAKKLNCPARASCSVLTDETTVSPSPTTSAPISNASARNVFGSTRGFYELPLSGPGKVNRKALREDARAM